MKWWSESIDAAVSELALTPGATRELATPQTDAGQWPATATHSVYSAGAWHPAAAEVYADGRSDIIPVIRFAVEED